MPLLKYHCTQCGKVFEVLLRANQQPEGCPHCKSFHIERYYQGKCAFGAKAGQGGGGGCSGSCAGCSGCGH